MSVLEVVLRAVIALAGAGCVACAARASDRETAYALAGVGMVIALAAILAPIGLGAPTSG